MNENMHQVVLHTATIELCLKWLCRVSEPSHSAPTEGSKQNSARLVNLCNLMPKYNAEHARRHGLNECKIQVNPRAHDVSDDGSCSGNACVRTNQ